MERAGAEGEERCVTVSSRILGVEIRRLERQGFGLTDLQVKAAWERAAYLTSVKLGVPFVSMHETSRRCVCR